MIESPAMAIAVIGFIGLLCQWLAWWVKMPAILFLILAGVAVGPVFGVMSPDVIFGDLLFPLVSVSVAIILFEGSLTLKLEEIRGLEAVIQRLIVVGGLITCVVTTIAAHYIVGIDWDIALLFGTLVVVTGPTVIMPMLRVVRPNSRISNILRWEGIVIDPIGALFAVLVYEYIISSSLAGAVTSTSWLFARILIIGIALGVGAGYILGTMLREHWIPDYLHNIATVGFVLLVFSFANSLEHESGLLAVTIMGVWLANMPRVHIEEILSFKENLTILLISGLFIILAARMDLNQILMLGLPALGVFAVIQFIARPLSIIASTRGSDLNWREKAMLSWIAPRGIVAAAVSALFALYLEKIGHKDGPLLVSLVFMVIVGTVVLQSSSARALAVLLKVAEPAPKGVLMVGANRIARALAAALKENNVKVLLIDANWENIRAARMEGLDTFYGNPVSEYSDKHLDLIGLGRMISVSPQREINVLASMRYRSEFGRENIFALNTSIEVSSSGKHRVSEELKGTIIGKELTFTRFSSLLNKGAKIRSTSLTDTFTYQNLISDNDSRLVPLLAVDKKERLYVFSDKNSIEPLSGWSVISLDYREVAGEENKNIKSGDEDQMPLGLTENITVE